MEFYFDETSIFPYFNQEPVNTSALDSIIKALEKASSCAVVNMHVLEDFYSTTHEGIAVSNLIYDHYENGDVRDLIRRLEYIINQSTTLPPIESNDSWAIAYLKQETKGCLVSTTTPEDEDWWTPARMLYVSTADEIPRAARKYYVQEAIEEAKFTEYSELMFDSIYFHEPADKIKNLGISFASDIGTVVKHLGYLNDHVISDFSTSANDREISSKAGNKGVSISPESNNTRRNRSAMSQRDVTLFGETISCEWHTKIWPTRGRIHFYPWAFNNAVLAEKIGRKVVIGIMCRHL